jgi:uncharacterized membrane protein
MLSGAAPPLDISGGIRWLLRSNSPWMGPDLALALLPLLLAVVLFRSRHRRGPLWWFGVAVFIAFLPNAPYVLTDLIHLAPNVRSAPSHKAVILGLLPLYAMFLLAGVESYVLCIRLLRRELARMEWRWRAVAVEATVHVACILGVVLGRVERLNSWDMLHPERVLAGLHAILRHPLWIAVTAVAVLGATAVLDRVTVVTRRWMLRMVHSVWPRFGVGTG